MTRPNVPLSWDGYVHFVGRYDDNTWAVYGPSGKVLAYGFFESQDAHDWIEADAAPDSSAAQDRESALPTEPKYGSSSFWQHAATGYEDTWEASDGLSDADALPVASFPHGKQTHRLHEESL